MALATSIYALGLPAFVLQKVYQPIYFARGDTKTPFRFAVFSMLVNSLIAFGLMPFYGWIAANCNHHFCLGYDTATFCWN